MKFDIDTPVDVHHSETPEIIKLNKRLTVAMLAWKFGYAIQISHHYPY